MMETQRRELTFAARVAAKAVVRLQAHGYSETQIQSILDPRFAVPEDWLGSGFFIQINGEAGFILTNCHVARNATHLELQSILTSDELFRLEIVGLVASMEPDVALLKFAKGEKERFLKLSAEKKIPCLKLGDSTKIRRSEEIRAIGYPLGMNEPNISSGQISNFISGSDEITERLVVDAPINPGNSGGPSIIRSGKVIGINTATIAGANSIGFVTPVHLVKMVLTNLEIRQRTGVCRLAAVTQKNSAANALFLKMKAAEGLIVRKVFGRGLAAALGLRVLDVILSINGYKLDRHGNVQGEKISRKRNIYDILYEIPLGHWVSVQVFRNGRSLELKAKAIQWAGEGFPSQPTLKERRFICLGGLIIQEVCQEIADALSSVGFDQEIAYQEFLIRKSKLIVTHICDSSAAMDLDLSLGDFVVRVGGKPVRDLLSLKRQIQNIVKNKESSFLVEFSSGAIGSFLKKNLLRDDGEIHQFGKQN